MTQPTPTVTRADVARVLRREFFTSDPDEIQAMLDEYAQLERDRVQLAILKLAAGRLDRLRQHLEDAKCDWRDVLGPAEYPRYTKMMFRIDRLPADEQQAIIDADWKQYQDWLI